MDELTTLTAELRAVLEEQELRALTADARELLEKQFTVGTVHTWGGVDFKKKASGDWERVKQHLATLKRTPKRASAEHLPDHPERYFKPHPQAVKIPVAALQTIRAREKGIKNAVGHMARAYNGEGPRRKPINVKDNGDGTYTVTDGNSTTAIARKHGWKHIHAVVEPPGSHTEPAHHEPHDEPVKATKPGHEHPTGHPHDTPGLRDAVKAGKLAPGRTLHAHVRIAKEFLKKHEESLKPSLETLKSVMPEGVTIKGRVKAIHSALGKLVRKPKYGTVDKLQDGTGMRVIAPDTKTLDASIKALKANYKIVTEDDYVSHPLGGNEGLGYRSFHAIIEDKDGLQKEVQLRTPNQNTHADWCHDVYKPVTSEQDAAMKEHAATISQYARTMGDYFYKVDSGTKAAAKPDCPPPVKQYFSCL